MRIPNELGELGKYDDACEKFCLETQADVCLLVVLGGNKGSGFSVSTKDMDYLKDLPSMLRDVAGNIERQLKNNPRN